LVGKDREVGRLAGKDREVGRGRLAGKDREVGRGRLAGEDRCPVPGDPRLRASDADRDRATALLREHHAAGRLTAEEFHERMDAAFNAKTLGEIDDLLADLPVIDLYRLPDESLRRPASLPHTSLMPRNQARAAEPARLPAGTVAVGAFAVVTGTLIAIWAVTAVVGVGTWFPWWLLVAIPWIWVMIRRARRHGE
jgi:DUF1707 SHOCT-like domain